MGIFTDIREKIKKLYEYGFQDLTVIGEPASGIPGIFTAEQLMRMNPDRYRFYMQLSSAMLSGNPDAVYRSLGIHRMTSHEREEVREHLSKIEHSLVAYRETEKTLKKKLEDLIEEKASNTIAGGSAYQAEGGAYEPKTHWGEFLNDMKKPLPPPPPPPPAPKAEEGKAEQQVKEVPSESEAKLMRAKEMIEKERNHPLFSPDVIETTVTDRVVFIAITFAIRAFSLTFLDWALSNRVVNNMESAIGFYVGIYLLMFFLWTLLVNVSDKGTRMSVLFFYISKHAPRGPLRIILHAALQLLILPIPFVLRVANSTSATYLSFEDRRRALRLVGNLSFIVWILTSFVAMRA